MKPNKFEDYNQKNSIKESLNIKKEENNSPFSDTFVFKKEENKITWTNEAAPQGREVNSNETRINRNKGKEDNLDKEDIEKATNTSSTASSSAATATSTASASTAGTISSVVGATAAVVTTAVVAVVGLDIATKELIDDKPQNCQINEVVTTKDSISFTLNVGSDAEAFKFARGTECNLTIELTCETYEDEKQEIPIRNYGASLQTFLGLQPETKYTIDVLQYSLLDFQKRSVLPSGPIYATTKIEEVVPPHENSITLDLEVTPLNDDVYYSTIDYVDDLHIHLYDYELRVFNDDPNQPNVGQRGWAYLNQDDPFSRQKVNWSYFDGVDSEPYFALYATTDDAEYIATHENTNISGRPGDPIDVLLILQRINIENLDRNTPTPINGNRVFAQKVRVESSGESYQRVYVATDQEEGAYTSPTLYITAVNTGDSMSFNEHDATAQTGLSFNEPYDISIDFAGENTEYMSYTFTVRAISHLQADVDAWNEENLLPGSEPATTETGVYIKICEETIDFDRAKTVYIEAEPTVSEVGFVKLKTFYSEPKLLLSINAEDPGYHIKSYSIAINDYEYEVTQEYYSLYEGDNNQYYEVQGIGNMLETVHGFEYVLYAYSDYNMPYNRTQKVEMYSNEDNFEDIDDTYAQGCVEMFYRSTGDDNYQLFITVHYEGQTYSSFFVKITDLDGNVVTYNDGQDEAYVSIAQAGTQTETTIPRLQGNYIVETIGYLGYNVNIFSETIDFGDIQISV